MGCWHFLGMAIDVGEFGTLGKGKLFDGFYVFAHGYCSKAGASMESSVSYCLHPVRNGDGGQGAASPKSIAFDARHAGRNGDGGK